MQPSFNILYFVSRFFEIASGASLSKDALASRAALYFQYAHTAALAIAVVLLIYYIWLRVSIHHVEEGMEHARHEAEVTLHGAASELEHKNERWEKVLTLAVGDAESDWRRAIIEADNILKTLLDDRGFPGKDIGEQLRGASRAQFASLDLAWEAHRLRNKIAHEGEAFTLTARDARAAIDMYRRVFEEFGLV